MEVDEELLEQYLGSIDIDELEHDLTLDFSFTACSNQMIPSYFTQLKALFYVAVVMKIVIWFESRGIFRIAMNLVLTNYLLQQYTKSVILLPIFNTLSIVVICATFFLRKWNGGYFVLFLCILTLITIQLTQGMERFLEIRGILMIHTMKLATMAFEVSAARREGKRVDVQEFFDYLYFPPTVIFGPYTSFQAFVDLKQTTENYVSQFFNSFKYLIFGLVAFLYSTCFVETIPIYFTLQDQFLTASSFRSSHYFVSFVAQAIAIFYGYKFTIVNAKEVEVPRSVSTIVTNWNTPMHTFLYKYVYSTNPTGRAILNVLFTFLVSSLLHGLDFQMTATLLGLGLTAFCETTFRDKFANCLMICVRSKACKNSCDHYKKMRSPVARLVNWFFVILSVYHLIFFGMPFTDEFAATGYPISHTLECWASHYYASFWISFALLFFTSIM